MWRARRAIGSVVPALVISTIGAVDASAAEPTASPGVPVAFEIQSSDFGKDPPYLGVTAQGQSCTAPCTLALAPGPTRVFVAPPERAAWETTVEVPPRPARVRLESAAGRGGYAAGALFIAGGVVVGLTGGALVAEPSRDLDERYRTPVRAYGVFSLALGAACVGGGLYMISDADKNRAFVRPPRTTALAISGVRVAPAAGNGGTLSLTGGF